MAIAFAVDNQISREKYNGTQAQVLTILFVVIRVTCRKVRAVSEVVSIEQRSTRSIVDLSSMSSRVRLASGMEFPTVDLRLGLSTST